MTGSGRAGAMSDSCKHSHISKVGDCMECGKFIPWYDRELHTQAMKTKPAPKPTPPGAREPREWLIDDTDHDGRDERVVMTVSAADNWPQHFLHKPIRVCESSPETRAAGEMRELIETLSERFCDCEGGDGYSERPHTCAIHALLGRIAREKGEG